MQRNHLGPAIACFAVAVDFVAPPPDGIVRPTKLENHGLILREVAVDSPKGVRKNLPCRQLSARIPKHDGSQSLALSNDGGQASGSLEGFISWGSHVSHDRYFNS